MLMLKGLKVARGNFTVSLPELTIADGECVALYGVSGSGKSTLLEAIGLLSPSVSLSSYVLDGIEVDLLNYHYEQALRVSNIGIMPQVGGLLPYLTINENLRLQITFALRQQVYPLEPLPQHTDILANVPPANDRFSGAGLDMANLRKANYLKPSLNAVVDPTAAPAAAAPATSEASAAASATAGQPTGSTLVMGTAVVTPPGEVLSRSVASGSGSATSATIMADSSQSRGDSTVDARREELLRVTKSSHSLKIVNEYSRARLEQYMSVLQPYIKELQLESLLHKYPSELSIGQRQRALFLRALSHQPRLVLMDEPTSALDPDNAHTLFSLIEDIAHRAKMSVIIVTHDYNAASRYRCYSYNVNHSYSNHALFTLNRGSLYGLAAAKEPEIVVTAVAVPSLARTLRQADEAQASAASANTSTAPMPSSTAPADASAVPAQASAFSAAARADSAQESSTARAADRVPGNTGEKSSG